MKINIMVITHSLALAVSLLSPAIMAEIQPHAELIEECDYKPKIKYKNSTINGLEYVKATYKCSISVPEEFLDLKLNNESCNTRFKEKDGEILFINKYESSEGSMAFHNEESFYEDEENSDLSHYDRAKRHINRAISGGSLKSIPELDNELKEYFIRNIGIEASGYAELLTEEEKERLIKELVADINHNKGRKEKVAVPEAPTIEEFYNQSVRCLEDTLNLL